MKKILMLLLCPLFLKPAYATSELGSWNESAKNKITEFVNITTTIGSDNFIPVADRIAVFDNDGTLWSEQPAYFQLLFALDQVKQQASKNPTWQTKQPYSDILKNNIPSSLSEEQLLELVKQTHTGISSREFRERVNQWINDSVHPTTLKPYTEMVFQPMLELLSYLQQHQYKTFIVSGGSVEFMRVWASRVYGIPSEQIIGSRFASEYRVIDGQPQVFHLDRIDFINDKEGKPVGIYQAIGKRPVIAFGNSDGDRAMLEWTAAGEGPRFSALIHHTDALREWAYDKNSHVGRLDEALNQAKHEGWLVVDMKKDWKQVYPN
ncbi:HAD family hydrolase [Pseudoalteromonas shioyasakiensis]|uniref:HAD family hydrolase n=1 Tax=Pseudoalteromonas shioyasakiensis TaxID=1190813 RepID=UPI001C3E30E5|nr:HAD family hydrolase [Pseudoalteromonas shioyasakiensis]